MSKAITETPSAAAMKMRFDEHGAVRLMTEAEGYVMVRRKGCAPFLMTKKKWDSLPIIQPALAKVKGE